MPRMINKNKETLQNSDAESGGNNNEPSKRLKKGPWTATEDAILTEYVKKQGEGNWNSIQKNSGLARCGKSCRLRWANHLRPNLKKGSFTPEEERIIIELHAKLGNKWARMAAQLPGRTDNEIKNYWNTRMKRRQRAGLPIYPHDVQQEAIAYQLQQEQQQRPITSPASFSSATLPASQISKLNYNNPIHVGDQLSFASFSNNLQNATRFNMYSQQKHQLKVFSESTNNGGLVKKPVSPVSPYDESSSSTAFNQSFTCQSIPTQSYDYNSSSSNPFSLSFSAMLMGVGPYETVDMMSAKETEVPSIQTTSLSVSPTSSYTHSGEGFVNASAHASDYKLAPMLSSQENNGLLGDLVLQGQGLSGSSSSRSDDQNLPDKGKNVVADESPEEEDTLIPKDSETHPSDSRRDENFCSPPSSTEKKPVMDDPLDEMNSMDDDLLCLLTNFPSCMPLPEWYRKDEAQTSMMTPDQKVQHESTDSEHNASPAPSKEHTSALAS